MPESKRKFTSLGSMFSDLQMADRKPHRSVQLIRCVNVHVPTNILSQCVATSNMLEKLVDVRPPARAALPALTPAGFARGPLEEQNPEPQGRWLGVLSVQLEARLPMTLPKQFFHCLLQQQLGGLFGVHIAMQATSQNSTVIGQELSEKFEVSEPRVVRELGGAWGSELVVLGMVGEVWWRTAKLAMAGKTLAGQNLRTVARESKTTDRNSGSATKGNGCRTSEQAKLQDGRVGAERHLKAKT
ncbi:hypothetical protein EDB83DRAFT_2554106 [Lactarius deliciosus]|nr:hypothetical protein EDB83DRAFT_2556114 [Lactarius deliciosus]KAH9042954.1 hypothetical protein EDB83DRAFT_2554106 [Lactarius deliciosus]